MPKPYALYVVLDGDYGQRLNELAHAGPVWIVDTAANRTVAQEIWAADPNRGHLEGVTAFKGGEGSSSNELDAIELHHGTHSANLPYTVLEIIGTPISARLRAELSQFGFDEFQETAQGFRAVRPTPRDDAAS